MRVCMCVRLIVCVRVKLTKATVDPVAVATCSPDNEVIIGGASLQLRYLS